MKAYRIHKPHFELVDFKGTRRGVIQRRGDYAVVNLATGEQAYGVGSCAYHLTNYGQGSKTVTDKKALLSALQFLFGDAAPRNVICLPIER